MSRSNRYDRGSNTFASFLATVLLSFLVIVVTMGVTAATTGEGLIFDMFLNMIDVLPYGSAIAEFAFAVTSALMGTTVSYVQGMFGPIVTSFADFAEEFCKLCLSAGLFFAFNEILLILCGLKNPSGIWNFLKSIIITMLCGYLAAFCAGLTFEFFFSQVRELPGIIQEIISGGMSLAIIICVFFIVKLLFFSGGSLLMFTAYFMLRYILFNIIKIMIVYLMILSSFILILWGNFGAFISSMSGLMVLLILVIGFDIMLKSVFGFGD